MKVVAFNGSPKKEGNTYFALQIMVDILRKEDIEVEIIQVGNQKIQGCLACNRCYVTKDECCINHSDPVNEWIQKMKEADGIILGTPTHYASVAGTFKSFLDRAFYVAGVNDSLFRHKVGAAIAVVRRSGGMTAFQELNNYLLYSEMVIPASNYWNVIHGTTPGQIFEDKEGVQIMSVLAQNMAWLLKLIENGKNNIPEPEREKKIATNFVRS